MPTIRDMFGPSTDDDSFNLDDFMAAADAAADESRTSQGSLEAPTTAPDLSTDADATGEGKPGDREEAVPQTPAAGPPSDPFQSLPPERREALLRLDEAMATDPVVRDQVFSALKPPPPRPAPTLPEHVDPESVEGLLWQQNQEILARFDRQDAEQRQAVAAQAQADRMMAAAGTAGRNFQARYPDLTEQEVVAIATRAGQTGVAPALAARPGYDPVESYEQALEATLWSDPTLRQRVAGVPSSNAAPPAPAVGPTPAGEQKKRVLHALSGAAVPIAGPPPEKAVLETRLDGSLTPGSKSTLVNQLAAQLRNDK